MVESRLHGKSNPLPHRGRNPTRRDHLADAGQPDTGRTWSRCSRRSSPRSAAKPNPKVNLVRYADDFIITGATKDVLENEVRPLVEQFLRDRGLQLSPEKTCVTHIEQGFDFLGQNLRKYDGKLLIKPSKKNTHTFLEKVRQLIHRHRGTSQANLIRHLNPSFGAGRTTIATLWRSGRSRKWNGLCGTASGDGPDADTPANAPAGSIQRYWQPVGRQEGVRGRYRRADARRETALVEIGESNRNQNPASCENPGRSESVRSALACLL